MLSAIKRYWFLIGLVLLLPAGIELGRADNSETLDRAVRSIPTPLCTGGILFLMSVTLDTGKLVQSLRRPVPVLTACGINMVLLPLICLPLLPLQLTPDLKAGLLIAASVPCTMAAASVWTRKAGGNDAVSLLVTLLTNGTCFLITPAWMALGSHLFLADAAKGTSDSISFQGMMLRLIVGALLPALLGQIARINRTLRGRVDRSKDIMSNLAQAIILTLVFISAFKGGQKFDFQGSDGLPGAGLWIAWFSCMALHLTAALIGWMTGGAAGFTEVDRRAVTLAGSQKTLPIGLLVSEATGLPFSIIPMLMFHASQLFLDTWIASRMLQREAPAEDSSANTTPTAS